MTPPFSLKLFPLYLLFILAILYSFSGIFFGLDFTDSFYHLNQALNPSGGIYLFPFFLSSLIINELIEFSGHHIIYLRVINWLLHFFSMLLPFIFIRVKCNRSLIIIYIICTLILYAPFNANILGYDTLSIFINSILFSLTALYIKKRNFYLLLFLALFGSIAIMIRLPNMVAIPIIFLFIWISERSNKEHPALYTNLFKPGFFLMITLFLTCFGFYLYYLSGGQFNVVSSNGETHTFLILFKNYLIDGIKIIGLIILLGLGLMIFRISTGKNLIFKYGVLFIFFLICLYYFVGISKFSVNYVLLMVAGAITITGFQLNQYRVQNDFPKLILYLFLFFLFINPMGSNTGLLKAYSLLVLLPFVLSLTQLRNKKYWFILLIVLIPFSIVSKVYGIYEDKNILVLNKRLEREELSPVHTNTERSKFLEDINILVKQLKAKEVSVFFYGDKSHIFHYLYPETSLNISSFFQPLDNVKYVLHMEEEFRGKNNVAVFIVNYYPENSFPDSSPVEKELMNYGFELIYSAGIRYYFRDTTLHDL